MIQVSRETRLAAVLVALGVGTAALGVGTAALAVWSGVRERRVQVVDPGALVRGAWQSPAALRSIIAREKIKTIVTLTAINADDPKYVEQAKVVADSRVGWRLVPMRGSSATLDQMAQAADLLAEPALQPVFFHCVGGHHRTSLVHAAYLIRHRGRSAEQAWKAIEALAWTRPEAVADRRDRALIVEFARAEHTIPLAVREGADR